MNDAKKSCVPELERITTECISYACVTLLVYICKILYRCTEVDATSISYPRTGSFRLALTSGTAMLQEWVVFIGEYVQDCDGECVEANVRPSRWEWLRAAAHVSSRKLSHN